MSLTTPMLAVALAAALVGGPALARRAAWRAVAREDPTRARAAARALRLLRPFASSAEVEVMVRLAARAQEGACLDAGREAATLTTLTAPERQVFAAALEAWSGDLDAAARRLSEPGLFDAAARQGELALALAALGEAQGARAMCARWREAEARGVAPADAGSLMVLAAHLGQVAMVDALLDASGEALPPARRACWRAVSMQRAGRADDAARVLDHAIGSMRPPPALRARLLRLRGSPLDAATLDDDAREALAALRDRVDARLALGELALRPGAGLGLATGAALGVLAAAFAVSTALGAPGEQALLACGALTVPLEGAGAAWRLLAYALLHADVVHLGVNALTLATFGRFVERRLGPATLAATLALGAAAGGAAALWTAPRGSLVIGASGAVFALVGASVAHIAREPRLRRTPEGRGELALLGALLLAQGIYDRLSPHVSGGAHVGGLMVGAAVGALRASRGGGRPG
ncbi:MAG: rhomboid family intramembrane serine protease [Polyangiales bacterium]